MMSPAVAILTWRGEEMTRACLRSLIETAHWTGPIVVVDNGSGTGEGERLAAELGVTAITLDQNGGVPAGYNAAITWARGEGISHVLLANNDLLFTDADLMARLARAAGPNVAAVGPIVKNLDGSIWSAGTRIRRWLGHAQRTTRPQAGNAYEVDSLDGSCLLASVDAMCRIGGLAPEFFLYWEETDWCARARSAGMRLVVDPMSSVTHIGGASGNLGQTRRFALRNSLLFVRRNVRGLPLASSTAAWLLGRVPFFIARRLREGSSIRAVAADVRWAFGWHFRDARSRGWRRPADGPDLCD